MKSLSDYEWKAFKLDKIFESIQRGKRLKTADHIPGITPYASSTMLDNGIDSFIGNTVGVRKFKNCISLNNSGSVGKAFYEPFEFIASDHVTKLERNETTKYQYLFLATMVSRFSEKYSFNREINDDRIKSEKILLPITEDGEPDWNFMNEYMMNIEKRQKKEFADFINK